MERVVDATAVPYGFTRLVMDLPGRAKTCRREVIRHRKSTVRLSTSMPWSLRRSVQHVPDLPRTPPFPAPRCAYPTCSERIGELLQCVVGVKACARSGRWVG